MEAWESQNLGKVRLMYILDVFVNVRTPACHLIGDHADTIVGLITIISKLLDLRTTWQAGTADGRKRRKRKGKHKKKPRH
ncbi:hypothetical protein [Lacticaseibacillus jixiensis]|uniref:hypothetical protein n=1 Tax=Lacticaseibacillus jixiensis TaxID=3231926 RepID=UPI0036F44974